MVAILPESGGCKWWRCREDVSGGQSREGVSFSQRLEGVRGGDIRRVGEVAISGGCELWPESEML